jgi:flagellar basal body rod protein FlgG
MTISPIALTALAAAAEQVDRVARQLASPTGDVVDLSEEMVKLLAAKQAFQTAVKLVQTADELAEHTLDILA